MNNHSTLVSNDEHPKISVIDPMAQTLINDFFKQHGETRNTYADKITSENRQVIKAYIADKLTKDVFGAELYLDTPSAKKAMIERIAYWKKNAGLAEVQKAVNETIIQLTTSETNTKEVLSTLENKINLIKEFLKLNLSSETSNDLKFCSSELIRVKGMALNLEQLIARLKEGLEMIINPPQIANLPTLG